MDNITKRKYKADDKKFGIKDEEKENKKQKLNQNEDEIKKKKIKVADLSQPSTSSDVRTADETDKIIEKVSQQTRIDVGICKNIIGLLSSETTIPFLVRYRSSLVGSKSAEELRHVMKVYQNVSHFQKKSSDMIKKLESRNLLTPELRNSIIYADTISELDEIFSPFKTKKASWLQISKDCGLYDYCHRYLNNYNFDIDLNRFINGRIKELSTINNLKELLFRNIAWIFQTNSEIVKNLDTFYKSHLIVIRSTRRATGNRRTGTADENKNFEKYYNFSCRHSNIKGYQVLAINRGEQMKILKVDVDIPKNELHSKVVELIAKKYKIYFGSSSRKEALQLALNKWTMPNLVKKISRRVRHELTKFAEKAGLDSFANNLKWLLLSKPIQNQTILAIDPGYSNGCKIAVVNNTKNLLDTSVGNLRSKSKFMEILEKFIKKYNVTLIGIGNGYGCRDVEEVVDIVLQKIGKSGNSEMQYVIVREQGVSVYSCSEEAKSEYPDLTPCLISAVSLAKRLIDPLGEYTKVEPKHLGIGMYQHDMSPKLLTESLDEVVVEVVSLIGVNLNTAPLHILKKVAGLSDSRAKSIIQYRNVKGPFKSRCELLKIKGIGSKTFEQCAGFVRILPDNEDNDMVEPLDQTIIHPENYSVAYKFITEICSQNPKNIGKADFIKDVKHSTAQCGKQRISNLLKLDLNTFELIYEALVRRKDYDIRMNCDEPLFRKNIMNFSDLKQGQKLIGRVENVTDFGSFINIGVTNSDMLLPVSKCNVTETLHCGQKVFVEIISVNQTNKRVELKLLDVLSKHVNTSF